MSWPVIRSCSQDPNCPISSAFARRASLLRKFSKSIPRRPVADLWSNRFRVAARPIVNPFRKHVHTKQAGSNSSSREETLGEMESRTRLVGWQGSPNSSMLSIAVESVFTEALESVSLLKVSLACQQFQFGRSRDGSYRAPIKVPAQTLIAAENKPVVNIE